MKFLINSALVLLLILNSANILYAMDDERPKRVVNKQYILNAIANYSEKITSNPNNEDGYINRAYLNYLIGNIEEAIKDYDLLISKNPQNEEFYLNRGYLHHISNHRMEALKDYELALKIKPDYAFAHNNRGVVLEELGRKQESLKALNTAIKIDPNYADAYYNRGSFKTRNNQDEEALEDFNIAIQLNPKDSASFNNRGVVKRKLNYNVGALSDFSIAIKLNPEDITAFANRGRLKKRYFDSEGAEEDFKTAIAIAEESPIIVKQVEIQKQIADIQRQNISAQKDTLNEPKVAKDGIQKIVYRTDYTNSEDNIKPISVKASVVKVDPKSNKSTEIPRTISKSEPKIDTKPVLNPQLAECYYIRALQKYILQKRESALKDFDMAIQHNPNYAEAYYYRAAIKRDFQDEGFVDDYKKAIQLNPDLKSVNDANVLTILKI